MVQQPYLIFHIFNILRYHLYFTNQFAKKIKQCVPNNFYNCLQFLQQFLPDIIR